MTFQSLYVLLSTTLSHIKGLPEFLDRSFVVFLFHAVAHAMVCTGHHQQPLGGGAGLVGLIGHFNGDEGVVRTVDEQHRHGAGLHGVRGGIIRILNVQCPAVQVVNGGGADVIGIAEYAIPL